MDFEYARRRPVRVQPPGPAQAQDVPPQREWRLEILGRVVSDVRAGRPPKTELPFHPEERTRVRFGEARPPSARDHDLADKAVDAERAHLRLLRPKAAIGDDPDRDALGRPREEAPRVRTEPHPGNMRPVDREELADEPGLRRHSPLRQDAVEDEAALAGAESPPRGLEESARAELAPDEVSDGAEPASNVVALQEERVVEIEDHEPVHRGSMRSGAAWRAMISMS